MTALWCVLTITSLMVAAEKDRKGDFWWVVSAGIAAVCLRLAIRSGS